MDEPDFRSDPSEWVEGKGRARRAWDLYAKAVNKRVTPVLKPVLEPAAAAVARTGVEDLVGFWVLWHLYGGFEGLERYGYHRATIFRKVKRFRVIFGSHPDEYAFPGINVDPKAYWAAATKKVGPKPRKS